MTPAEIQALIRTEVRRGVREELDRLFSAGPAVHFGPPPSAGASTGASAGASDGRASPGLFFQRFVDLLTGFQRTLDDTARRLAAAENKVDDVEQLILRDRVDRRTPPRE